MSLQLALNAWTCAHRDPLPPPPPGHPPPPASCLVSLGDDDKDDERCQHNRRYEEAPSEHQQGFVLEHPHTRRARFMKLIRPAGLRGVILGKTATTDDLFVESDGGFGFGPVVG